MPAGIFGQRFVSHRRKPWHALGYVVEQELSAREAYALAGEYDVETEELFAGTLATGYKAVIRAETDDDPRRVLSVVRNDYELVTPSDLVGAWDEVVKRPVETLGALHKGATFFFSTMLPTVNVHGDEVENYMLVSSPMTGSDAIWLRVTPVRVVCQNTLIASVSASTERHRIVHDSRALPNLKLWLDHVYTKAEAKAKLMTKTFRAMADRSVNTEEVGEVLEMVYTMPALPRRSEMPEPIYIERREKVAQERERAQVWRDGVMELFEGKGTGMKSPAARGTAWGLYNAFTEAADYGGRGKVETVAESALVGDRARIKATAYDACVSLLKK